jgi:hypothetical protein
VGGGAGRSGEGVEAAERPCLSADPHSACGAERLGLGHAVKLSRFLSGGDIWNVAKDGRGRSCTVKASV